MLAVKFVPAIVNVWFAEALPYVVVKSAAVALADVLLMVMDGEVAVEVTATLSTPIFGRLPPGVTTAAVPPLW